MDKYCKINLKGVSKHQLKNYKITEGIQGKGEEIEATEGLFGYSYQLKKGVYICQFNGIDDDNKTYDMETSKGEVKFCPIEKMFTVDDKDLGKRKKLVIPKIKINNLEAEGAQSIYLYSDHLEEKFYDNDDINLANLDQYTQLGKFKDISFDTPAWNEEKNINQFTTNQERFEFLEGYIGKQNYYLYKYEFPVVVFTTEKLSGKELLGDLEILKSSDKLNILYQAQVHGNEYAAGEGALTVIEKLIEDNNCLEKLNIVIIPCVNQLGNTKSTRDCGKININRDFLKCQAKETVQLHNIFFGFLPELVIDGHTFTRRNAFVEDSLKKSMFDVRISSADTLNVDENIKGITDEIVENVIKDINSQGMRAGYYGNSTNCNLGRLYYNLLGGCSILFESEGTRSGKYHFKRNVSAQVKGILSILTIASQKKDIIKNIVKENRKRFENGSNIHKHYVFNHKSSGKNNQVMNVAEYDPWGNMVDMNAKVVFKRYDEAVRQVEIPESLTFDLEWFESEMEDLFEKNHVIFEKKQNEVFVDMKQITQLVIVELLRNTDKEL